MTCVRARVRIDLSLEEASRHRVVSNKNIADNQAPGYIQFQNTKNNMVMANNVGAAAAGQWTKWYVLYPYGLLYKNIFANSQKIDSFYGHRHKSTYRLISYRDSSEREWRVYLFIPARFLINWLYYYRRVNVWMTVLKIFIFEMEIIWFSLYRHMNLTVTHTFAKKEKRKEIAIEPYAPNLNEWIQISM